jgi:nucleotide-binding universal stress UspA family protein
MAEVEYLDDLLSSLETSDPGAGGDPRLRAQRVLQHYADVAHRFRQAMGDRLMSRARAHAQEKGVQQVRTILEDGDPAATILRLAKGLDVDMIVLGSRGLGDVKGLLMGSVSHKVAHLAECTCVAVK